MLLRRRLLSAGQCLLRLLLLRLGLLAAADLAGFLGNPLLLLAALRRGLLSRPLGAGGLLGLFLRQPLGAGGVGFLSLHLLGQLRQAPGRLLHLLLRFLAGRLLVGRLGRLLRGLVGLRLALGGFRRLKLLGLAGQLLLVALKLRFLGGRGLRILDQLRRLVSQLLLFLCQRLGLFVVRLLAGEGLFQPLQLAFGLLL